MDKPHIEAVNGRQLIALLSDGRTVPITNLFDDDGEEVDDWEEAARFVAGEGDCWYSDWRENFDPQEAQ